jgi:signal transduction histidine kinase
LIIDDSRSVRSVVCDLLSSAGYAVCEAANGEEGLALARSRDVDVILLDVEMPVMDGFQVLERLSQEPRLFAVIMFTTQSSVEKVVHALTMGADDYIAKPFREEELQARVAAAGRSVAMKRDLERARLRADAALLRLQETQARLFEQQKIRAVAELAAGFAHEINNPLGFMQSNVVTLRRYADYLCACADACLSQVDDTPPVASPLPAGGRLDPRKIGRIRGELGPMVDDILEGCARIAHIVQSFVRLEQGLASSTVRLEELNQIVDGVLNQFRATLPAAVACRSELADEPLPVLVNLGLINVTLVNLIQNAVEAVGDQGEITVRTRREADRVFCHVANTGVGIGKETLERVFDPFFTTKASAEHPGLGLTLAKCFASAQEGSITITSPGGVGAVVTLSLPAAED